LQFIINVYVFIKQPVPQALSLAIQQREEVHCGWDRPKKETLDKFFARYPEIPPRSRDALPGAGTMPSMK
jgi:hypothetical protein